MVVKRKFLTSKSPAAKETAFGIACFVRLVGMGMSAKPSHISKEIKSLWPKCWKIEISLPQMMMMMMKKIMMNVNFIAIVVMLFLLFFVGKFYGNPDYDSHFLYPSNMNALHT